MNAARGDPRLSGLLASGEAVLVCVPDAGDPVAKDADVTAYEVKPAHLVAWAARLLLETRRGQRPVEVIVPGSLHIRGAIPPGGVPSEQGSADSGP